MLRFRGGGKRAKYTVISDFKVIDGDSKPVRDALNLKFMTLKEFVSAFDVDELYSSILEQRNSDRIITKFCQAFKEYTTVQEMWANF